MQKAVKLNTGNLIPSVGLGVYLTPKEVAEDIVYKALKVGYRHIDSAAGYKNEEEVANGIYKWMQEDPTTNTRELVYFTTKIWNVDHGYEAAKKAIEKSLENVKKIGYIDLFLIHSPQSNYEKRHGTWLALQEAVEAKKVKDIGVSNYGIPHLKELLAYPDLKIKPSINQIELHPWLARKELVKFCEDHAIVLEAYSPLARGQKVEDPKLAELAKKVGKTPAQVLLNWSLSKGFVILPKTVTESRLLPNLEALDFKLSDEDMATLDQWDEYFVSGWDPTVYPLDK